MIHTSEEIKYRLSDLGAQIGKIAIEYISDLEKENAELKAQLESERDLPAIAYMQGTENQKKKADKQLTYAKTIIQDLLDNTDEYARQKAEDFLKECE